VAIVDDHPVVREAFANLFEFVADLEVVGTAGQAGEAMELLERGTTDVAVIDYAMPHVNGAELTAMIRRRHIRTRVLIFTGSVDPEQARSAASAGADGILLKSSPIDDLLAAIREVAGGGQVVGRELAGVMAVQGAAGEVVDQHALSPRELDVLRLLARGRSNKDVAKELFISQATAKSHVENILRKLGTTDRAGAVAEGFRRRLLS
jgi:DNA-binding NarL/FixJ family response regulator